MSNNEALYARNEKILQVPVEEEMKSAYLRYAMSVIIGRALPDVRDGLKPVQRRLLYCMKNDLNLEHNKPYKKSARIVGDTMGRYHPHGDAALYETLVRMAQDFSMRYPLVDGQGNFGSIDGDPPAAMRYTEARLASISDTVLQDLDKDTVAFGPNFDESLKEPLVLPSILPNLLVNGSSGIAVGMATNIPPHNLSEVVDAITSLIDNPDCEIKDLMRFIKGPDFPTGGIILGAEGIKQAFTTGRGSIKLSARANIEQQKSGRESIVITEIPYQVNKTNLIQAIADLVQNKKIEGISDVRDETDREGVRIVVELKRDQNSRVILNQLYKHTQMQTTFGVIMLELVDGKPRVLNIKEILQEYVKYRKEIVTKRTQFELDKAQNRAHILEGFKIAVDNLDAIISIIKKSENPEIAKQALIKKFSFSDKQTQAILEMQLQRLTSLERKKTDDEYLEIIKQIEIYKGILASVKKILQIIKQEVMTLKEKYGDERRTQIVLKAEELETEDLIAEEDMVVTISHIGYIKRLPVSTYRKQKRGGKGVSAGELKEEDFIEHLFIASTHDYMLFFTDKGKVYWLKVFELPQASRQAKGRAIVNCLEIEQSEKISSLLVVRKFEENKYLVMATQKGIIKKTTLSVYSHPKKAGIVAINIREGDKLVACQITDGKSDIFFATKQGKAIRFSEECIRAVGRTATGVRGIRLSNEDSVIAMEVVGTGALIFTITENGLGKCTSIDAYRKQRRGGKGIINIKCTQKNGSVIGVKAVQEDDELMIITQEGMMVRTPAKDIRTIGRSTQGIKIIKLNESDSVANLSILAAKDNENSALQQNGEQGGPAL
ncbi:DNA gyrase subunit A [bacterium Unc6]|nr:DNA gyrase subunit A [bacterium Unc6]